MSKIGIIIRREFSYRVKKRSFILLTILMPFLLATVIILPLVLSTIESDENREVVVIDRTNIYSSQFADAQGYRFVASQQMRSEYRSDGSSVYAVLSIWDDLSKNPGAVCIYSRKDVSKEFIHLVETVLGNKIMEQRIASIDAPGIDRLIKDCREGFKVPTVKWSDDGSEQQSSTDVAMFVGIFFSMLIYMFVLCYGGTVMQSVTEEKTNRIMELMVSSVKPFTLMMGKIVGIALVGLLQMAVWGLMLMLIISVAGALLGFSASGFDGAGSAALAYGATVPGNTDMDWAGALRLLGNVNFWEIGWLFVVFFIGGYLLYASFFAAVGSAVNSSEDTGQFMLPVTVLMVFALYAGLFSIENPDGPLAFWCSIFPLTSPIVMMIRLPFGVPLWQELLSILLLYLSAVFMIWISGKIYRVGILMYGKKPSLKELVKWVRYK